MFHILRHLLSGSWRRDYAIVLLGLATVSLSGCASLTRSYMYQPTPEEANKLTLEGAQQILSGYLPYCYDEASRYRNFLGYRDDSVGTIEFLPDHYTYTFNDADGGYRVYYKDMQHISMHYVALGDWPDYFEVTWDGRTVNTSVKKEYPRFDGTCNQIHAGGHMPVGEGSKVIVDAMLRLKLDYDQNYGPAGEVKFEAIVEQYRSPGSRPELPEQAKIYNIQAKSEINKKNFASAADLFGKALALAPWWPEGHFNRALALAELSATDAAVVEMQRYLYLVPNAPDAEAVRTKIAEWQAPEY